MTRPLLAFALTAGCTGGSATTETGTADDTEIVTDTDTAVDTSHLVGNCDGSHTTTTSILDTSDFSGWAYYDLDSASVVTATDGWDFRMQTWLVEINAGVEVGGVEGAYDEFSDRCKAPMSLTGPPLSAWYVYNGATHEITPLDVIYYVLTTEGAYHRLIFDGYYEDGNTTHTPGITHGVIDDP